MSWNIRSLLVHVTVQCTMYLVCMYTSLYSVNCIVYNVHFRVDCTCKLRIRVYQNVATSSENYITFPKVGPHYKEKACKFLARSDYSLRPNSCVLFEIFVARRKVSAVQ